MLLHSILAALSVLSLALALWQWIVARRFPLHQRASDTSFAPGVTLLKPLKGCDAETAASLRSWLTQDYAGPVQVLFGVAAANDPVCDVVRQLIAAHPQANAELVICGESLGANAKVSTLIQLQRRAAHDHIVISDADVRVPADLLKNILGPLRDPGVGLVNCFYSLANPATLAMQWEAVAINADFWSQVLQSRSLKPLDFALGAVMATRKKQLDEIGGFTALVDFLADDYQLGNQIARRGHRIELCAVVVECWERLQGWREVWAHQLRWARTIRVCQPVPYFFSLLSNATLWSGLLLVWSIHKVPEIFLHFDANGNAISPDETMLRLVVLGFPFSILALACRFAIVADCMAWLCRARLRSGGILDWFVCDAQSSLRALLTPLKDLLQVMIWTLAFLGDHVTWRGERYRVLRGGKLVKE